MCGRFTYLFTWKQLHRLLSLAHVPPDELGARYNVAPTQLSPVIRLGADGQREGVMLKWGLVPSWASDASIGNSLINARSETIRAKPAFRAAYAARRCLVPISGFYEWRKLSGAGGKSGGAKKQPHWIGRTDRQPMYLAGLWERWEKGEAPLETFTIITTEANALLAPLHDRMPVLIPPELHERWLDPKTDLDMVEAMLRPADPAGIETFPVSSRVNSPRLDVATLLEQVEPAEPEPPGKQSGLWPQES